MIDTPDSLRTANRWTVWVAIAALGMPLGVANWVAGAEGPFAITRARLAEGQPTRIVCLGDSVTGVYYHTGGLRAYTDMLGIALRRVFPRADLKMVNAGISGNTTQNGLDRLERDVLAHEPTLVTIMFGLNDMVRVPLEQYESNLRTLIERCRGVGAEVLLATPNAVIDTSGRPITRLEEYCAAIRRVGAELRVPVADCNAIQKGDRERDQRAWRLTMSDAIHPNMDGHQRMAEILAATIAGRDVSLADVAPPSSPWRRVPQRLQEKQPIRVLAMPPCDGWIEGALKKRDPSAQVLVTTWNVAGLDLGKIEQGAQQQVRAFKPDLVIVSVPRGAAGPELTADQWERFANHYTWILNWSLSFGVQEWDCLVVHPAVLGAAEAGHPDWDDLIRQIVSAQDLPLIDRLAGDEREPAELFSAAVSQ